MCVFAVTSSVRICRACRISSALLQAARFYPKYCARATPFFSFVCTPLGGKIAPKTAAPAAIRSRDRRHPAGCSRRRKEIRTPKMRRHNLRRTWRRFHPLLPGRRGLGRGGRFCSFPPPVHGQSLIDFRIALSRPVLREPPDRSQPSTSSPQPGSRGESVNPSDRRRRELGARSPPPPLAPLTRQTPSRSTPKKRAKNWAGR